VVDGSDAGFQADEEVAFAAGKEFAATEGDYTAKLENLLPKLSRVRKTLAQRRTNCVKSRRGGVPNWRKWLDIFRAMTGVQLCNKTIKRHLDEFEGIKPVQRLKMRNPRAIPAETGKQLAVALLVAHDLVNAIRDKDSQDGIEDAIQCFLRAALSPAKLDKLLSSLQDEASTDSVVSAPEMSAAMITSPTPATTRLYEPAPTVVADNAATGEKLFPEFHLTPEPLDLPAANAETETTNEGLNGFVLLASSTGAATAQDSLLGGSNALAPALDAHEFALEPSPAPRCRSMKKTGSAPAGSRTSSDPSASTKKSRRATADSTTTGMTSMFDSSLIAVSNAHRAGEPE
jgi:hypothetical protein